MGRGLRSRDLIGWRAGAAARGRGSGSRRSFTSWPQVQPCTAPVKPPAGARPSAPSASDRPLPTLFLPHPWVGPVAMSCFEKEGRWSLSFAGAGFLGVYHVGAVHCLRQRAPRLLRGASRFYGSSSGSLVAVSVVSGLSVGESGG